MAQIEIIGSSYPDDNKLPQGCKVGSGYKANQKVINVNFADNAETPPGISKEEIEAHIVGVVMIEHFNINKGIHVFGERAETAVMKYLQKIHVMNTYEPMDAYMLTCQERKDALYLILFVTENRNGISSQERLFRVAIREPMTGTMRSIFCILQ